MNIEEARTFHDRPGTETRRCRCGHLVVGPPEARLVLFRYHWQDACTAIASVAFHPDGSLASVVFL